MTFFPGGSVIDLHPDVADVICFLILIILHDVITFCEYKIIWYSMFVSLKFDVVPLQLILFSSCIQIKRASINFSSFEKYQQEWELLSML